MSMRLIILNPHVNYCGKMVFNWLFRFPHHHKYNFIWQEYLKRDDGSVAFLVDGSQSSFLQTRYFKKTIARSRLLMKMFTFFEMQIWLRINHINPHQCAILYSLQRVDPNNDILFTFGFTSTKSEKLRTYPGIVLVHLTHYHHDTEAISNYFSNLKHGFLVADSDLRENTYFHHYFPTVRNVYHLPLTISSSRFQKYIAFKKRINKCFASGSMSVPTAESYVRFFGTGAALNPMREMIYNKKDELTDVMDAYMFPHNEALKAMKAVQPGDSSLKRTAKRILPPWMLKMLFRMKLPYFSFDIVEKYNQYTTFMSPEERTGLPSMKLLEGILCGSVLVGIDDPMYINIGFRDGVNYIAYRENDLDDLVRKLQHYQHHADDLEKIAIRGEEFAKSLFRPEVVAEKFWNDLESLLQSFRAGNPQFSCSFIV